MIARGDEREVAGLRDHRVVLVGFALRHPVAGMRVDVGEHAVAALLTDRPQLPEALARRWNVPDEAFWVEVVEVDDRGDDPAVALAQREQERAALTLELPRFAAIGRPLRDAPAAIPVQRLLGPVGVNR